MKQEKAERLVQIAKMYYEENLTQSEIAKKTGRIPGIDLPTAQ